MTLLCLCVDEIFICVLLVCTLKNVVYGSPLFAGSRFNVLLGPVSFTQDVFPGPLLGDQAALCFTNQPVVTISFYWL